MKPLEPTSLAKLKYPRHELFAQAVAAGEAASAAYERIYDTHGMPARVNSSRLMARPEIVKRIEQLQAMHAASNSVTVASLTDMLVQTFRLATITKQSAAAAQSVMGIAKLHGLLIDKTQVDAIVRRPAMDPDSPDEMSEDRWLSHYAITKALGFDKTSDEAASREDVIDEIVDAEIVDAEEDGELDREAEYARLFGKSEPMPESLKSPKGQSLKGRTIDLDAEPSDD